MVTRLAGAGSINDDWPNSQLQADAAFRIKAALLFGFAQQNEFAAYIDVCQFLYQELWAHLTSDCYSYSPKSFDLAQVVEIKDLGGLTESQISVCDSVRVKSQYWAWAWSSTLRVCIATSTARDLTG